MSKDFPATKLEDVLYLANDPVEIEATNAYPIAGVYSFGRGLFARQALYGSETTYKFFHRLHKNDFVLSQLKGWEGALARVTQHFDNWFLSPQFQSFRAIPNHLDISYLEWYCKQAIVWDELKNKSQGMGARRDSVSPKKFLSLKIPLPPIEEQRRIVAHIEEFADKIARARGLQHSIQEDAHSILLGEYINITKNAKTLPMKEVAPLVRRTIQINLEKEYPELGIRSFGKGTFHKASITGAQLGTKRIFEIRENDLLFNIVFAWEGAIAVAKKSDDGRVGSHRFLTCVPKEDLATPQFLCFHFLTEKGLEQLLAASPGSAGRNRTLGIKALEDIQVPVPPIDKQQWFTDLLQKINLSTQGYREIEKELTALLPSILDKAFRGVL